jgi:hypothetical protein
MSAKRQRREWRTELAEWRCELCGRNTADIGAHPLPVRQQAHLLPNRLTGNIARYGGVKNPFNDNERVALLERLGETLRAELRCNGDVWASASSHCYELCGECHEEILSEPVYLPSVMQVLQSRFKGASRVEKLTVLTRMLQLGAEALKQEESDGKNQRTAQPAAGADR